MNVITLETEMTFTDALQYLMDGKCIGIRPKDNTSFLVKYRPKWMDEGSSDYLLCWRRSVKDDVADVQIRIEQYLGTWQPVVINSNDLPENIKSSFILKNITGLLD